MAKTAAFVARLRIILVAAAFLLFAVGFCGFAASMERLRTEGETLILELAPVDPRAFLLGDYMDLDYRINWELSRALDMQYGREYGARIDYPRVAVAVLSLGEDGVGSFSRLDDGTPLAPDELRLRFRTHGGDPRAGASAYYFEEGFADEFEKARYGEFCVNEDGKSLLLYMLDADLQRIIPVRPNQDSPAIDR